MVDPDRRQLDGDVEADETLVGGRKPGKRGRGAAGKTVVAGAIEAAPSQTKKRELGRLRLEAVASAAGLGLERFLVANVAERAAITTDCWRGYGGLAAAGYDHHAMGLARSWREADERLPAVHIVFGLAKRGPHKRGTSPIDPTTVPSVASTYSATSTRSSSASIVASPRAPPTASPAPFNTPSALRQRHIGRSLQPTLPEGSRKTIKSCDCG
jgi:transposase-like protein